MADEFEGGADALPDEAAFAAATEDTNVSDTADTTPEKGADTTSGTDDAKASEGGEGEDADPAKDEDGETRSQRRRRERREYLQSLERDKHALANENQRLRERLSKLEEPHPNDFENPDDYIAERAAYTSRKAAIEDQLDEAETAGGQLDKTAENVKADGYKEASADARSRYADFDQVAHGGHWSPTQAMLDVILESDRGPDLAYYLGANPEEAARISRLSPTQQAAALGRIEATRLPDTRPKPPPQTKAPPPISPLRTTGATAEKSPDGMNYEEYRAWRAGKKAS